jgi:hypothetical protein
VLQGIVRTFGDRLCGAGAWLATPLVERYICSHRDRLLPDAMPLPDFAKEPLSPYFEPATLSATRLFVAEPLPLLDPPFVGLLERFGLSVPTLSTIAGITLDQVVATREWPSTSLLFHELVHVVQFRTLGVCRFSEKYVEGFLRTGKYEAIPLEAVAYELEARFVCQTKPFSVEEELSLWMERDGLLS